jgi:hypothetical protein
MKEGCSGVLVYKGKGVGPLTVNFSLVAQEEFQYVITFSTAWR